MARKPLSAGALFAAALLLAACGEPSKSEILDKADDAGSRSALREALGEPDDLTKLGPIEQWTYDASDGAVTFLITGDEVRFKAAGGRDNGI